MSETKPDKIRHPDLRAISVKQERAIEALLKGETQTEAAEIAGVTRQTVNGWARWHPGFIAALNSRRLEIAQAHDNRLRQLLSRSMDVLENALDEGDRSVAQTILRLDHPSVSGPMDPDAVIEQRADTRNSSALIELSKGANPFHDPAARDRVEDEMSDALADLEGKACR
jgi:hypothetical protein